jgi:hypothetical protein
MSSRAADRDDRWAWLPPGLRPRDRVEPGSGRMWLVETTLLLLAGVLLATATINDVSRQVGIEHRLSADLRTWRVHTGHDYRNIKVDQQIFGSTSQREVVCGNTRPGGPRTSVQLCLEIWGPTVAGVRQVHGGWYLPPHVEDEAALRSGCFGDAVAEELCPR